MCFQEEADYNPTPDREKIGSWQGEAVPPFTTLGAFSSAPNAE